MSSFRILVCGGRTYGKVWSYEISDWVTDARAIEQLHRVLGETCCRTAARLAAKDKLFDCPSYWSETGSDKSDWIGDTPTALEILRKVGRPVEIVHGDAIGADKLGGDWAKLHGVTEHASPADWKKHGKAAGYIRNASMLKDYQPDCVVAFFAENHENRGTKMMCKIATDAKVPVWRIK